MTDTDKKVSLGTIFASLNIDNYYDTLMIIRDAIKDYTKSSKNGEINEAQYITNMIDKYISLVKVKLGAIPSFSVLTQELNQMSFDGAVQITDVDELNDIVYLFINRVKHNYLSSEFAKLAQKVKDEGLSDEDIEKVYMYLSSATSEAQYENISDAYLDLYNKQTKFKGLSFLQEELDRLTGGILPGQICTILGFTGSMKTTYSSNIAYNAIKQGKNVLYLSLEEQPINLYSKWMSRASKDLGLDLEAQQIIQHKLDEDGLKKLIEKVYPYFVSLPGKLYMLGEQDISDYNVSTLESKFKVVDKRCKDATGHGIDVLVVDHIQILKFARADMKENSAINYYVSFFRQQSLSWLHSDRQIIVMLLSQANRDGYMYAKNHDGLYLAQHAADGSEIERSSAYIVSVFTEAVQSVTRQLKLSGVKLRGSALPLSTLETPVEGEYYTVGPVDVVKVKDEDEILEGINKDYSQLDDILFE